MYLDAYLTVGTHRNMKGKITCYIIEDPPSPIGYREEVRRLFLEH